MKHTTAGTFVVIAVAAVALLTIVISRSSAVESVYPLERVSLFAKRSVWPRIKGVFNGPGYAAENVRLHREVETLSMLTGEIARLERENDSLRRSLKYAARDPKHWLAAPVLVNHAGAESLGKVIRVGRGTADGVEENAIVASPDGLVGQVTFVTPHTAEVTLLTDRTLKVVCTVAIGNGRTATGILQGGDGDELLLTNIRGLSADIPQATVTTSRRGGVFPAGFDIGNLIHASETESGEWQGTVRPSVDFDNLDDVFIRCER